MSIGSTNNSGQDSGSESKSQTISFRASGELVEMIEAEQDRSKYKVAKSEIVRTAVKEALSGE